MLTAGLVLAALAALVHVYIFVLESVRFDRPATWRVFGIAGPEEAAVVEPLFYNQGWYNLFLAVVTAAGIGLTAGGNHDAGLALVCAGCGSMLGAALVLVTSNPRLARSAAVQGAFPALALLVLLVRLLA